MASGEQYLRFIKSAQIHILPFHRNRKACYFNIQSFLWGNVFGSNRFHLEMSAAVLWHVSKISFIFRFIYCSVTLEFSEIFLIRYVYFVPNLPASCMIFNIHMCLPFCYPRILKCQFVVCSLHSKS